MAQILALAKKKKSEGVAGDALYSRPVESMFLACEWLPICVATGWTDRKSTKCKQTTEELAYAIAATVPAERSTSSTDLSRKWLALQAISPWKRLRTRISAVPCRQKGIGSFPVCSPGSSPGAEGHCPNLGIKTIKTCCETNPGVKL